MSTWDESGSYARVVGVQFGRVDGVFGLHLRLAFPSSHTNNYTVTDMAEIEELMDSFRASNISDLMNRKMRVRRYPRQMGAVSHGG
jgi:hypothetical protein